MGKSKNKQEQPAKKTIKETRDYGGWWWCMSHAPRIEEDTHWFQMIPIILFSAISILLVHMYSYTRPMEQFYWSGGSTELTDFFSHYKVICIMIAAILALVMLLYRFVTQSATIKKTYAYVPMALYIAMVLISYACSEYKEFALWGYNDRFEGTVPLLAYMVILFFVFNMVNSEKNIKHVLYPILGSATLLGLLGVSQATDHDFFRTALGQKLLTPNLVYENGQTAHQMIDEAAARGEQVLSFTFQNKEIYQTVYNINYVSFYLTLLLPLVGLLFIRSVELWKEEPKWKPFVWGSLFALLLYNLIGSASSGGFFGMGIVVLLAFIVLNKKILRWWKPVAMLLTITLLVAGVTYSRWLPELTYAFNGAISNITVAETSEDLTGHLDYFDTVGSELRMSVDGKELTILPNAEKYSFTIEDSDGNQIALVARKGEYPEFFIDCEEFKNVLIQPAMDSDNNFYLIIKTNNPAPQDWDFIVTTDGIYYFNGFGSLIDLDVVPSIGFKSNLEFGSGRGYIWSRTFPMMKSTMLLGKGADTYCLYFPHSDYVGKYNCRTFSRAINIIVDKPHNMYMGSWIGTGGISTLALIALWGIYIIQSIRIYIRKKFDDMSFLDIVGVGIALGITGFVFTGLVDDSTVSTMPFFYTLFGMGLAINMMHRNAETN